MLFSHLNFVELSVVADTVPWDKLNPLAVAAVDFISMRYFTDLLTKTFSLVASFIWF